MFHLDYNTNNVVHGAIQYFRYKLQRKNVTKQISKIY